MKKYLYISLISMNIFGLASAMASDDSNNTSDPSSSRGARPMIVTAAEDARPADWKLLGVYKCESGKRNVPNKFLEDRTIDVPLTHIKSLGSYRALLTEAIIGTLQGDDQEFCLAFMLVFYQDSVGRGLRLDKDSWWGFRDSLNPKVSRYNIPAYEMTEEAKKVVYSDEDLRIFDLEYALAILQGSASEADRNQCAHGRSILSGDK